jgi:plasmid maintenance system antidote protein VapI
MTNTDPTSIEQLYVWLAARDQTLYGLAREMGVPYNTLYQMVVQRHTITDKFLLRFIRQYGCAEAVQVFPSHLTLSTTSPTQ